MIPAIDENGEFVTATLRNGEKATIYAMDVLGSGLIHGAAYHGLKQWTASGKIFKRRRSTGDIIDLPDVRARVDAARVKREHMTTREAAEGRANAPVLKCKKKVHHDAS